MKKDYLYLTRLWSIIQEDNHQYFENLVLWTLMPKV